MEKPTKLKRGRPEGSTNRYTKEAIEKARNTGLLPHEILLSMARGEPQTEYVFNELTGKVAEQMVSLDIEQRKDAAKAAAPYFAPKISTVEIIRGVEDDDLDAIIKELAAQAGLGISIGGEEPEGEEGSRTAGRPRTALKPRA